MLTYADVCRLGMAYNADANAYTDFRSTVYTLSAPVRGRAAKVESNAGLFGGGGVTTAPAGEGAIKEAEEEEEVGVGAEGEGVSETDNSLLVLDLLHEMAFKALLREQVSFKAAYVAYTCS